MLIDTVFYLYLWRLVHCISQFGNDFRPDYKFVGALKTMFPEVRTGQNMIIISFRLSIFIFFFLFY